MNKKRILCVEDHSDTCELISAILENYEVVSADSGADALRRAQAEKFDLYLLDYHLPDGTGAELALFIRKFDKLTPIIFVTGANSITEHEVLRIGGNGLIKKASPSFVVDLKIKVSLLLKLVFAKS